jgi:N-formylglutamate amidohydrolase
MSNVYEFLQGNTPLLVSVPHDGRCVPDAISARMTPPARDLPDTDWHVARLYDFAAELGASVLIANYSRYVVDVNRPANDEALYPGQLATGLCPTQTFAGDDIYRDGADVPAGEAAERVEAYWRPYHERLQATLDALRETHGYALLWDAHSIESRVPRLFDGELPALNIGTYGGRSCDGALEAAIDGIANSSPFSSVLNGRFQGGFITRHYGDPERQVHAVQLEIAQRVYMDESARAFDESKAARLRDTLRHMLTTLMQSAKRLSL